MEKIKSNDAKDILSGIQYFYNTVESKIVTNPKYQIKGDLLQISKIEEGHVLGLKKLHTRQYKRLKRYLNKFIAHQSLHSINTLFWMLKKSDLIVTDIKVVEPKHEEIQVYKQKWIAARDLATKALQEYNIVKGDYYKNDLEN
jgi:hypothetical protein